MGKSQSDWTEMAPAAAGSAATEAGAYMGGAGYSQDERRQADVWWRAARVWEQRACVWVQEHP